MGGHSHWATTKRHKASVDAKRGKIFTKIIREITIAARLGGRDPEGNPRLRLAIAKAKDVNMPSDNIKKAIQRGTGELPGIHFEEFQLEGYGPGGCALLIDLTSDNRNRTVAETRNIFSKQNCNLAEAGSVAWQFHKKGLLIVEKGKVDEGKLTGGLGSTGPGGVTIDVPGVGSDARIPLSTYYQLPDRNRAVTLVIHTHVRDDAIQLCGFFTQREKHAFLLLRGVSGIGPKL